jgi:hypothetical protein
MADVTLCASAMKETCSVVTSGRHSKGLEDVIYLEASATMVGQLQTKWLIVACSHLNGRQE